MASQLHIGVETLPGVGPKKAGALSRLDLTTLGELAEHFPRSYLDRRQLYEINTAPLEEEVCICAVVAAPPRTDYPRRGFSVTRTTAYDHSGSLSLTFFNNPYVARRLEQGKSYVFCGKIQQLGHRRSMTSPVFEPEGAGRITGRIVPVYRLTAGISAQELSGWIARALEQIPHFPDSLPPALRSDYRLPERDAAVRTLHAPDSFEALALARRRMIFEELFYLTAGLQLLHTRRQVGDGCLCRPRSPEEFTCRLPYTLTGAQQRAVTQIFADLTSGRRMNRLLQGDVGSGKTVVAAAALWLAVNSGWQCALMAPTEILAHQHFATLSTLLEGTGIRMGLLTAGLPAGEKRSIRRALARGEVDLIIGTHALFGAEVDFARLGLVIADEQHRFGVAQRAALAAKGGAVAPHVLVMSATPIPRTLALMIYGDLEVSVMDELPPGRLPVKTLLIGEEKRRRMEGFLRSQVEAGHQVYVVCPAVEEREECPLGLKNVQEHTDHLRSVFPDLSIDLTHGRLSAAAKESAMRRFLSGDTQVLVSTTVIEVGVDAPNATLMIIEDADRFGLSQLHQLRGRVGRNRDQSWCVLVSSTKNEDTLRRLRALCGSNDGFVIAQQDLELRGPGDFFGSRQHGLPQLRMADLATDTRILTDAQQAARSLLAADPELKQPEHQPVLERIRQLFSENPDIFN